jgi:type IV pilus assembly protein PilN
MIRINLLPVREIEAKVGQKQELLAAGVCLALILIAVFGVYGYQARQISQLEAEFTQLQTELAQLNKQAKEIAELQKKVAELREKNKIIADLEKKRTGPVQVMESLSGATPARLWLTQFKETGGNVIINGLATDNLTIAEFLKTLTRMPHFNGVELVETVQNEQDSAALKKFTIKSTVTYQAPAAPATKSEPAKP